MKHSEAFSVGRAVIELDRGRLVEILQDVIVMFEFIDGGQFNAVALKLNRHPHLSAGIPSGDVVSPAAHAARRTTGADVLCN